jgi:2-phospho-L-lactate transferase/gluconeogenesis factor (CofD/UPF0052 family)
MNTTRLGSTRVAVFCGGRGCATITRELVCRPRVHLSLIINGYDDGRSTGFLREFLPGMLGPSDFRKNMSRLLGLEPLLGAALQQLLECRLLSRNSFEQLNRCVNAHGRLPAPSEAEGPLDQIYGAARDIIFGYLAEFFRYAQRKCKMIDYADLAVGNMILAGAYLTSGSFNCALAAFSKLSNVRSELLNVSQGENRWLVGLKKDGELLGRESDIVRPQSASPIRDLYLMESRIPAGEWSKVGHLSVQEKDTWLRTRESSATISCRASETIRSAHIIIYGPGTQHSSLFPSYRIAASAIQNSKARVKILIMNLNPDYDILGLSAKNVIDRALSYMGDSQNRKHVITDALVDVASCLPYGLDSVYRGVRILRADFRSLRRREAHSGRKVVQTICSMYEEVCSASDCAYRQRITL